jgi:hypothetical protein
MPKIKITKRTVEALKVATKDYIAFDVDLPGFGVRVMPSGKRFFLVQYRRHGRTRRVMIGQYGVVTAELARREAIIMLGSVDGEVVIIPRRRHPVRTHYEPQSEAATRHMLVSATGIVAALSFGCLFVGIFVSTLLPRLS